MSGCEQAEPTITGGSGQAVVIASVVGRVGGPDSVTTMLQFLVSLLFLLSVTFNVKLNGPALVGVPAMIPLAAPGGSRPGGSAPPEIDQE